MPSLQMLHVLIYPSLENVAREGWLLVRLRHPNIVHFYGRVTRVLLCSRMIER